MDEVKIDEGKRKWQALPLVLLEPLADLMEKAIESGKYKKYSCLGKCENADADFYDAQMRHVQACQIDPLAIDEETQCYHSAQVAFNALMRLYHCRRDKE